MTVRDGLRAVRPHHGPITSWTVAAGGDTARGRVPGHRRHLRYARRVVRIPATASHVAAGRLVGERRRVRGAHQLRTLSAAERTSHHGMALLHGRRPGGPRSGGGGE